ncbi:hypothetical protein EI94DRAFT_1747565 [Lactarius quietus]|nr:hypothetical protein EI94DRAFT_1747565 [Lactarius quietus]
MQFSPTTSNKKPQSEPGSSQKNIIIQPLGVETPLEGFFSQYPNFQWEPSNSPVIEFDRLCKSMGWKRDSSEKKDSPEKKDNTEKKDSPEKKAAREAFHFAMKREFDALYGSDEDDINNWHKLCYVLRIDPLPDTLRECRSAVLTKHVNLVDLVHGSKEEVRIFETEKELSVYTKKSKKYFPKEDAKDGGVLRALRRRIFSPRDGTISRRRKGRRDKDQSPIELF